MLEGLKVRNGCSFAVMLHINAEYRKGFKVSIEDSRFSESFGRCLAGCRMGK